MKRWRIMRSKFDTSAFADELNDKEINPLMDQGWEPFAAAYDGYDSNNTWVWLRRAEEEEKYDRT